MLWIAGVAAWFVSGRLRLHRVQRIPVRILVGGTRGKTTLARLLTAGLRATDRRVCSRVAGRRPEESLDGESLSGALPWRQVPRHGEPNTSEVPRWLDVASAQVAPDVAVIENQGLAPEAMWAIGHHFAAPTLAVITDAEVDHLDTWPTESAAIAWLHVSAVPRRVSIVTADDAVARAAAASGHPIVGATAGEDLPGLPPWMRTHIALAEAALHEIGVDSSTTVREALVGEARRLLPSPRVLTCGALFLDLFDANDPVSAARALGGAARNRADTRRVALFAHRRDRAWRWTLFRPWLAEAFDRVLRFDRWPDRQVIEAVRSAARGDLLVGLGNAVGPGLGLLESLDEPGEH